MTGFEYDALLGSVPHTLGERLAAHTGFRTGGPADCVAFPRTAGELTETVRRLQQAGAPFFLLGNGSNVLAPDEGYRGCVVKTGGALNALEFLPGGLVRCGAGNTLAKLCKACAEQNLSGLEFAYGIPGTVGGALYMNAGAYGGEMKDVAAGVTAMLEDGTVRTLDASEMRFSYRHSAAQERFMLLLAGEFRLTPADAGAIHARMAELMNRRREKQPLDLPSCGSTFKRPPGGYASQMIDECGLRGFRYGGAQVSEKHCGFVVNAGGATTADILALVDRVREIVLQKTGVRLECEIQLLQ